MHTNLDYAIASVLERGQALDIPNVFAVYLQRVVACELSDGVPVAETEAIAHAALVSFERAMDKYPMAPLPAHTPKTKTKTKKASSSVRPDASAKARPGPSLQTTAPGAKRYSVEVEQLRWDYQKAMWRATMGYDDPGCTCLSCGSLLALREKAELLSAQCEDLIARCEEWEQQISQLVPAERKRRPRKAKKRVAKKSQGVRAAPPFDPYAPSTSAAMI